MSNVPPSPPNARMLCVSPFAFIASEIPDATAAAFSNATCIHGTFHAVSGYGVENTSRQPVAFAMIVFFPAAFRTILTAIACPHPAQALCPCAKNSSSGNPAIVIS